jgi:hypothetical protein
VLVEQFADGELRILPTDRVRERVRHVATRVVSEHSEALEILATHSPNDESPVANAPQPRISDRPGGTTRGSRSHV